MSFQTLFDSEPFGADLTLIRFYTGVFTQMIIEAIFVVERFWT